MVRERERLVADGGEGEREGEEEMDICPGRRRMEKRKGSGNGAQRLVNGRFKTRTPARDWTEER